MPARSVDPNVGDVFGRWTVMSKFTKSGSCLVTTAKCTCGAVRVVKKIALTSGRSKSCGCLQSDTVTASNTSHGMAGTPIYVAWKQMRKRVQNPAEVGYKNYGGRGIIISENWSTFEGFYKDMGDRPFRGASIERLDTNKGYCKENCVWADRATQNNNRRDNILYEYKGKMYNLRELATFSKVGYDTLRSRLYAHNWTVERAVETPTTPQSELNKLPHSTTPATRHKLYPQP